MKMSVGGRRGFGRRTHSKTCWPGLSAIVCSPQMIYISTVSVPEVGDDHPGHDQVSLEKQREGRANGTTGVRRERGIREKAHDETGI